MDDKSWHLPRVRYDQASEAISVLFLQRLPESAVEQAISKLNDCDTAETPAEIATYPWIRDERMTTDGVNAFIKQLHRKYDTDLVSVILVETEEDDCVVVASNRHASPQLTAARVDPQSARSIATEIRRGISFADVLSEHEPIDLPKDFTPEQPSIELRAPVFDGNLKLSGKEQLTIISLVHLGDRLGAWKDKFAVSGVNVTIVDTDASSPSRADLYLIFEALEKLNTADDRIGYIFFIDNVLEDQIIAVSRTGVYELDTGPMSISLLPIHNVVKVWQTTVAGSNAERTKEHRVVEHEVQEECGDIMKRERIYDPRVFDDTDQRGAPTVWFLQDFTLDEARHIRNLLEPAVDYSEGMGAEYAYMGHHADSIEELLAFFQKGDTYSPTYDPQATMRFHGYPRHFFAVDRRIFDDKTIILGSSLDFYHPTHQLGWHIGTVPAGDAQTDWINLDIANIGPEECAPDAKRTWLSDLKAYSKEYDPEAV